MKLMASQAVQQQPFKMIDGSGGWRDRCAKWCVKHLQNLEGGAIAYADTMGPGKTAAMSPDRSSGLGPVHGRPP